MNPIHFAQWLSIPWGLSEAVVFLRDRQPGTGKQVDRGSRAIILAALVLTMWLAFTARLHSLALLPGPPLLWQTLGAALMVSGIAIRQRAVRHLGQYFRTRVTMLDDHRLITDGPYARLRHPSYIGGLLCCFAIGVALGSAVSLAAATIIPTLAFAHRIRIEERALAGHFGDAWIEYRGRTKALLPFIW